MLDKNRINQKKIKKIHEQMKRNSRYKGYPESNGYC